MEILLRLNSLLIITEMVYVCRDGKEELNRRLHYEDCLLQALGQIHHSSETSQGVIESCF